jgi:hypothetical protein
VDSGATSHLCNDDSAFSEMKSESGKLNLANNGSTSITAQGKSMFTADVFGESKNISLSKTLFVPDLRTNLLSVGKITEKGCDVIFKRDISVATEVVTMSKRPWKEQMEVGQVRSGQ